MIDELLAAWIKIIRVIVVILTIVLFSFGVVLITIKLMQITGLMPQGVGV